MAHQSCARTNARMARPSTGGTNHCCSVRVTARAESSPIGVPTALPELAAKPYRADASPVLRSRPLIRAGSHRKQCIAMRNRKAGPKADASTAVKFARTTYAAVRWLPLPTPTDNARQRHPPDLYSIEAMPHHSTSSARRASRLAVPCHCARRARQCNHRMSERDSACCLSIGGLRA